MAIFSTVVDEYRRLLINRNRMHDDELDLTNASFVYVSTKDGNEVPINSLTPLYYAKHVQEDIERVIDNVLQIHDSELADFNVGTALFNDFIDLDKIMTTIRERDVCSYRSLYQNQMSIGIRRLDIPLRSFTKITRLPKEKQSIILPHRYIFSTDISFLNGNTEYDLRKCEELYNTPISLKTISDHPEIFDHNIIPFIDGRFYQDLQVLITENEARLLITIDHSPNTNYKTGFALDEFNEMYQKNEMLYVYVVPNYYIDTITTTRKDMATYDINIDGKIKSTAFHDYSKMEIGNTFGFLNSNYNNVLLRPIVCDFNKSDVTIPYEFIKAHKEGTDVYYDGDDIPEYWVFSFIVFNKLHDIKVISPKDEGWFMLTNYELPLPKSNIIPIIKDGNVYKIAPMISFDMYYPAIYHINNVNDKDLRLLMFYEDNEANTKYRNYLERYYMEYDNVLEMYKTNTIPDIVKDYMPIVLRPMSEEIYNNTSLYFPKRRKEYIAKLFNLYVNEDPTLFVKYLYMKLRSTSKFTIFANKLNLKQRLRTDTTTEVGNDGPRVYFKTPHYVINLKKIFVGSNWLDFRVYVDNIAIAHKYYSVSYNNDNYYIYIDQSLVNEDSVIEIEKYNKFTYRKDDIGEIIGYNEDVLSTITDDNILTICNKFDDIKTIPIKINITDDIPFAINVYNVNFVSGRSVLFHEDIRIFIYSDVLDRYIEINEDSQYPIDREFYVTFKSSYIGKQIGLLYNSSMVSYDYTIDHDTSIFSDTISASRLVRNNDIRIFKNGLLMPNSHLSIDNHNVLRDNLNIYISSQFHPDDRVTYEVYPIGFNCEFQLDEIHDEKGYVDTGNSLSYPFDLKWYDVYLNGKRLNKSNIVIISSSRFFVQNVNSLKNLYIYKREDINYAYHQNSEKDIDNILMNHIPEFFEKIKEDMDLIEDVADDIIADAVTEIFDHIKFVSEYLEFMHINPNIKQLSPAVKAVYPDLFDEYDILKLVTNDVEDVEYFTSINSNVRREYMKQGNYRYSFTPLYIGNHVDALAEEYLCDPVTGMPGMKTKNGEVVSSGMLLRLSMHKDRLNQTLINNNLTSVSIYQIDKNQNTMSINMGVEKNIFDSDLDLNAGFKNGIISFDIDVLEKGQGDVMMMSQYDPMIQVTYSTTDTSDDIHLAMKLSEFNSNVLELNCSDMTIKGVKIKQDENMPSTAMFVLYSILIAF